MCFISKMGLNEMHKIVVSPVNNANCGSGGVDTNNFSSNEHSDDFSINRVPAIVPCYNGKTLKIHEELVVNGLSAISIKHHNGNCVDEKRGFEDLHNQKRLSKNMGGNNDNQNYRKNLNADLPACLKDKMKWRNSFWNIHKPELSKLTWPENFVSSLILQDFFHNHLRTHGTFCEPLHEFTNRSSLMNEEFRDYSKLREIVPPRILPPDEKIVSIMEKSRSVQINDEDLDPEIQVHKSRAEFCVTIGEYVRRPPLKRTTSQVVPKCITQSANRFESLPVQHENLLSKEIIVSEEKVSAVIGSTDFCHAPSMSKNSKKLSSGIVLRCTSLIDSQRLASTSPPSLNDIHPFTDQMAEDSGDPTHLRTILSPGEDTTELSDSRRIL